VDQGHQPDPGDSITNTLENFYRSLLTWKRDLQLQFELIAQMPASKNHRESVTARNSTQKNRLNDQTMPFGPKIKKFPKIFS
jgi:hypothetical protein